MPEVCQSDGTLFHQIFATILVQRKSEMVLPLGCPSTFLHSYLDELQTQTQTQTVTGQQFDFQGQAVIQEYLKWKGEILKGEDHWMKSQEWELKLRALEHPLLRELALLHLYIASPNQMRAQAQILKIMARPYISWWMEDKIVHFKSKTMATNDGVEKKLIEDLLSSMEPNASKELLQFYLRPLVVSWSVQWEQASQAELKSWSNSPQMGTNMAYWWILNFLDRGMFDEAEEYLKNIWGQCRRLNKIDMMITLLAVIEKIPDEDIAPIKQMIQRDQWPAGIGQEVFWDMSLSQEIVRQLRPVLQLNGNQPLSSLQFQFFRPLVFANASSNYALLRLMELGAGSW